MKTIVIILLLAVLFILGTIAIIIMWSWVVPDVFSGAVVAKILPDSLTFAQALKLSLLIWILVLAGRGGSK